MCCRVAELPGGRTDTHKQGARKNVVSFGVTITRCHDIDVIPPPVETLEDAAAQHNVGLVGALELPLEPHALR